MPEVQRDFLINFAVHTKLLAILTFRCPGIKKCQPPAWHFHYKKLWLAELAHFSGHQFIHSKLFDKFIVCNCNMFSYQLEFFDLGSLAVGCDARRYNHLLLQLSSKGCRRSVHRPNFVLYSGKIIG